MFRSHGSYQILQHFCFMGARCGCFEVECFDILSKNLTKNRDSSCTACKYFRYEKSWKLLKKLKICEPYLWWEIGCIFIKDADIPFGDVSRIQMQTCSENFAWLVPFMSLTWSVYLNVKSCMNFTDSQNLTVLYCVHAF